MTYGYFRIPRSLTQNPLWLDLSLECRMVFLIILENVCYEPRKFNDNGKIIDLKIGQMCTTERDLEKLCGGGISRIKIQRNLVKLKLCDFLSQEVSHRKSILTIKHLDTYDLVNSKIEPENEPRLSQDRAINKEGNNIKEKKDKKKKVKTAVFFDRQTSKFQNVTPEFLQLMKETYPEVNIEAEFRKMRVWLLNPESPYRDGKQGFITHWLNGAPKETPSEISQEENLNPNPAVLAAIARRNKCETK